MAKNYSLVYISDEVFYQDNDGWYTLNGFFPLEELVAATGSRIGIWSFFGRLAKVDRPPAGALKILTPAGVQVAFVGPALIRRGIGGYICNLPEYSRQLRTCLRIHDVVWIKANFVTAWLALPFLSRCKALRVSHQVGDPAGIAVGPKLLRPLIRLTAIALTRQVHRLSDLNVYVSRELAASYQVCDRKPLICNESRLRVNQILSPDLVRPNAHSPFRLLYVGRLSPEKGVPVLLRALAQTDVACELEIAGTGQQQSELELLAAALDIRDKVRFLGAIPWGEPLFGLMRNADALVLPSHTEGFGLVIPEAMSQGLPVIASEVGGIPELITDGTTGLMFRPGDAHSLADAITRIATNGGLRTGIARNALAVAQEHTLDRQLQSMFSRIASILQAGDPVIT